MCWYVYTKGKRRTIFTKITEIGEKEKKNEKHKNCYC